MKRLAEWRMCNAKEQALIEHCKAVVHRLIPGATLILYGSRARGEAAADSDYDVLILVDGEVSPGLEEAIGNALYDVELAHGAVVAAIVFDRKSWNHPRFRAIPLHQYIEREGVLL